VKYKEQIKFKVVLSPGLTHILLFYVVAETPYKTLHIHTEFLADFPAHPVRFDRHQSQNKEGRILFMPSPL